MTRDDHKATIEAAKEFKHLLDTTILADVAHGVNLTPFESEVHHTGNNISRLLSRLISTYGN